MIHLWAERSTKAHSTRGEINVEPNMLSWLHLKAACGLKDLTSLVSISRSERVALSSERVIAERIVDRLTI